MSTKRNKGAQQANLVFFCAMLCYVMEQHFSRHGTAPCAGR